MRGRWAQGLEPRYFTWVITGRFAVSERPGGFARNHRKVRRQEELLWLAGHGFTHVLSLLDSPHNLHAYEEVGLAYEHVPLGRHDELPERLRDVYTTLSRWLDDPSERVLMHHEEFGDRLLGVVAGFLLYSGLVQEGPHAIVVLERLTGRQLGSVGREIVAATVNEGLFRYPRPAPEPLAAAEKTTAKAKAKTTKPQRAKGKSAKGAKPEASAAKKVGSGRGKKAKA
ncbi:MAG TPA: hypothetical protein VKH36_13780 [Acidimicrobiia bacterium]|nr:hypothetical protein [Acidimicrobiia bacterium]